MAKPASIPPGRSLTGTSGADEMNGAAGNDIIRGAAGNDTIRGGRGDDELWGDDGNDILSGGQGRDAFHYGAGNAYDGEPAFQSIQGGDDSDAIKDFNVAEDTFVLHMNGSNPFYLYLFDGPGGTYVYGAHGYPTDPDGGGDESVGMGFQGYFALLEGVHGYHGWITDEGGTITYQPDWLILV